jgi:hypothetical protein
MSTVFSEQQRSSSAVQQWHRWMGQLVCWAKANKKYMI